MRKFPRDAPRDKVIKALKRLSFEFIREGNHIAMLRKNSDGSSTPLTLPNHRRDQGAMPGASRSLEALRRPWSVQASVHI